jgi:VWFA-related protein
VVKVETNLVTTPVSVLDRNGRFIPGLKKKDFKIFENDVPQEITYFQSSEQPFTVVLMIDASPSTQYHIDQIHFAALTFVNQLRPNDKVMVVAFDQRFRVLSEPTSDREVLFSAIYKAQFGSGTSLYDAVDRVADLEIIKNTGRKAVVLFTDGVDTTSRRASFESTIESVEEIDALFYPIRYDTQQKGDQVSGLPPGYQLPPGFRLPPGMVIRVRRGQSDAEYETGRQYLAALAEKSGGRMFEADTLTNLDASFAGVAEELRRQYSIGYYANTDGEPGERKRIKIHVTRPKVVVRAKTSYIVKAKPENGDGPESGLQSRN